MHMRRKLVCAVALLLVCFIVLLSASYAWLAMSRAPEITGIDTRIGSNGSLEIALLSNSTYMNPSLIKVAVGDSVVIQDATVSNLSWGNVIDLSDESYGLHQISMYPSRLNVSIGAEERNVVNGNMLIIPSYGKDGRFSGFMTDTVSAAFQETEFTYSTEQQSYGVRGIGTISHMTSQQSALTSARSLVQSYTSAATSATESVWRANGAAILDIYYRKYFYDNDTFHDSDVAVIRDSATRMLGAMSYIDSALRQGVIGYASSVLDDEASFKTLRSTVENTAIPLTAIINMIPTNLPSGFSGWIASVEAHKVALKGVVSACDALEGGNYTWNQISFALSPLINVDEVYLGEKKMSSGNAFMHFSGDNTLTLSPDAGIMAEVADFVGNYRIAFAYSDIVNVEVETASVLSSAYLLQVSSVLKDCQAASGNGNVTQAELNDTYGYAVDMAFRCNETSDLLLQTTSALRVNETATTVQSQGGGSYMRFASEQLNDEQIVLMMDAIRIGFLDNQNTLLGVAKLNTSNYSVNEEGVMAPLYLYDYSVSVDGSISMGERRTEESAITTITKNTATVITVIVWLDGDHVDNSLAAVTAKSMEGMLNLQFASNASLLSAELPIEGEE